MTSPSNISMCCVCLIVVYHVVGAMTFNIAEYMILERNNVWNISQPSVHVVSLLGCSTHCSAVTNVCGFNFIRQENPDLTYVRTCHCILDSDLGVTGSHIPSSGSVVYIKHICLDIYKAAVSPTTSTSTSTTSTTSTTTSTSTTTTTSTTATTTSTTPTPVPTTSTTTTTSTTPVPTTTSGPCPSTVDALVCTDGAVYVFIGDKLHVYNDFSALTAGPDQTQDISTTFPQVTHPLVAGYNDGSNIHLINGGTVWKYSTSTLSFVTTTDTASMFSSGGDSDSSDSADTSTVYDAMLYIPSSTPTTYLFHGTSLDIVESGSIVRTVSLSNNGNNNPYKCSSFSSRPRHIVGACSVDTDRHVFISEGQVYLFTFSTDAWTNNGDFKCS